MTLPTEASAFLFTNGAAMFFNERGEQISRLQRRDWAGLAEFLKLYPNAPVSLCKWREWRDEIPANVVQRLLKSLRTRKQR